MELEAGSQCSVYRVSYDEENVGKMVKHSKTRITWKFVCHGGRRHTIELVWSKSTGKQEILMDGASIWFGRNKGRSVLDHNWTTPDESLKLHVLATCAPKLSKDFRSYDLLINGQLFASLPSDNQEESELETPWTAEHEYDKKNPKSIIQILYPEGYSPPVDKNRVQQQQQQQQQRQRFLETTAQAYPLAITTGMPSSNNSVSHTPPMVDLLT